MATADAAIGKRQWTAFGAAWIGWAFDGLDGYLYTLVALPFVAELLRQGASPAEVAAKASLIQAVFMFGWAAGGAVFGRIGDRLGRSKTLTLTILTYAIFTGGSFLAQAWWHLLIFRFLAALGIGGEWAAGSALVSETLHSRHRAWASALLQTGYMTGMILAAYTVGDVRSHGLDYRCVFLIGILPAFATVWILRAVPEPEEWRGERARSAMPPVTAIFRPGVLNRTVLALTFTGICLTTVWAFLYFVNPMLRGLPEVARLAKVEQDQLVMHVTIVFTLWTIVGNFFATYLAKFIGYRKAFAFLMAAALVCFYFGFGKPHPLGEVCWWLNAVSFFGTGIFATFPLYVPRLFPVLIRTTAAGFSYNFGRVMAGVGTLIGGQLTMLAGGPAKVLWWVGFLYVPGFCVALFMPEPKDD